MYFPPVTGDPWSPEYAKHWDEVYLFLHGKKYHQNNEFCDFDCYSTNSYPFCSQDPAVVSKHFIAISTIVGLFCTIDVVSYKKQSRQIKSARADWY